MFWDPRASRTLSLVDGLCLGEGAEEQERRARSRPRAANIARLPQALLRTALIPAGWDPACGDPPLSAAPQFRTAAQSSDAPQPAGCSLSLQRLQLCSQKKTFPPLPSPRRGGTETTQKAAYAQRKPSAASGQDAPRSRVVSKPTP